MKYPVVVAMVMLFPAGVFAGDEEYKLGQDSMRPRERAQGQRDHFERWHSKILPGTVHNYWVYVPAQHDGTKPACVMVFQDGHGYVKEDGDFRVPVVFDNLIHRGEMPVSIGIFINPGRFWYRIRHP